MWFFFNRSINYCRNRAQMNSFWKKKKENEQRTKLTDFSNFENYIFTIFNLCSQFYFVLILLIYFLSPLASVKKDKAIAYIMCILIRLHYNYISSHFLV